MNGLVRRDNDKIHVNYLLDIKTTGSIATRWNNNLAAEDHPSNIILAKDDDDNAYVTFTIDEISQTLDDIADFSQFVTENAIMDDAMTIALKCALPSIAHTLGFTLDPHETIGLVAVQSKIRECADALDVGDGPLYQHAFAAINELEAALKSENRQQSINNAISHMKNLTRCATAIASECNAKTNDSADMGAIITLRCYTEDTLKSIADGNAKMNSSVVIACVKMVANVCQEAYDNHLITQYAIPEDVFL